MAIEDALKFSTMHLTASKRYLKKANQGMES